MKGVMITDHVNCIYKPNNKLSDSKKPIKILKFCILGYPLKFCWFLLFLFWHNSSEQITSKTTKIQFYKVKIILIRPDNNLQKIDNRSSEKFAVLFPKNNTEIIIYYLLNWSVIMNDFLHKRISFYCIFACLTIP